MTGAYIGYGRVKNSNRIISSRLRWLALKYLPQGISFFFKTGSIREFKLPSVEVLAAKDEDELYICQKLTQDLNQFMKKYDGDDDCKQRNLR